jgi:uncharacterized protein YjfI (DUF2170 family)
MPIRGQDVISSRERTARRRRKLLEQGLKRVEVWVRPTDAPLIQDIATHLRRGSIIHVSPPRVPSSGNGTTVEEHKIMEALSSPWTIETLKQALQDSDDLLPGEFECKKSVGASPVLEVTVEAAGGVTLYVAVQDEQIVTTTILWARADQEDPEAFEAMMLRAHKVCLPLSALSIDTIDRQEYYELFGTMSARSTVQSIIMEFRTIANNAIELARDIGPRAIAA